MANFSEYGKKVKIRLIELGMTNKELQEAVAKKTGLYFDSSYLSKILNNQIATPKIIAAINEILNIEEA